MRSRYWHPSESLPIPVAVRRASPYPTRVCRQSSWVDSGLLAPNPFRRPAGMKLNPPGIRFEPLGWADRPVDPAGLDLALEHLLVLLEASSKGPARTLRRSSPTS